MWDIFVSDGGMFQSRWPSTGKPGLSLHILACRLLLQLLQLNFTAGTCSARERFCVGGTQNHTERLYTEPHKFPVSSLPGKEPRDQSVWSEAKDRWQLRRDGKELKQRGEWNGKKQWGKIALPLKTVTLKFCCWISRRQEWTFPARKVVTV